ncbi:MAG: PfkB family carbohydrate kinase [Ignavibacteriaceae bacterium]
MKLLIIGHSVEDHFIRSENEEVKPGGIYYTASALNYLKAPDDEIVLLTAIENGNYGLFSKVYDNFDKSFFQEVDSIPKVFLKIYKQDERDECYNKVTENLNINIDNLDSFDGVLINMITGFDISLEQLINLRKSFNGFIYIDVHTLSRGLEADGKRNFRIIPDFSKWAGLLDIIQVNQHELFTLSDKKEQMDIVREILNTGTKYLILTMEDLGARVFYLDDGDINSLFKPANKIEVKNKIGCGDIFGAVFFYNYLKNSDINESLEKANNAAGLAAAGMDLKELNKLTKDAS